MARELPTRAWPGGADVAVSLTFDVDAESGWLGKDESYATRLTSLSEARFGVTRGLPRILSLLDEFSMPATFYVPGDTVVRHPAAIQTIVAAGHEIGHHGHMHLRSDRIDAETQRKEIERGLDALESTLSLRPAGYRSASWELTPETFELLLEFGFEFDSSCMGDDRPYLEEFEGQTLIELPVHWSLDDWPHFAWSSDNGGNVATGHDFLQIWLDEFDSALADRRHVTYTMHPEVIGRGYRMAALRSFIDQMRERGNIWFVNHRDLVRHLKDEA